MPNDDQLTQSVAQLSPAQLGQLHGALFQLTKTPPPQVDPAKLQRLWGAVSQHVTSKSLFDPQNVGIDPLAYSASYQLAHPEEQKQPQGLIANAWDELKGLAKGMFGQSPSPLAPGVPGAIEAGGNLVAAGKSAAQGKILQATGQAASAIPMVGPVAQQTYQTAQTNPVGAVGRGLVDIAALGLGAVGMVSGEEEGLPVKPTTLGTAVEAPKPSPIAIKAQSKAPLPIAQAFPELAPKPIETPAVTPVETPITKPVEAKPTPKPIFSGGDTQYADKVSKARAMRDWAARQKVDAARPSQTVQPTLSTEPVEAKAVVPTPAPIPPEVQVAKPVGPTALTLRQPTDVVPAGLPPDYSKLSGRVIAEAELQTGAKVDPSTLTERQLAQYKDRMSKVGLKTPTKNFELDDVIRQIATDPSENRMEVLRGRVRDLQNLPKEEALPIAQQMDEKASWANEQAQVIRQVLDRQDDVSLIRQKLGAWEAIPHGNVDEETGLPIKGSTSYEYINPATPAERDLYNRLLGRKLEQARALDPTTKRVIQTPEIGSPEEQSQVDEFIQGLTNRRDAIVDQVKSGMPISQETLEEAAGLTDQITDLTGMRSRYAPGRPKDKGVAGKAQPVQNERGVWGPDPNAPLPELTQNLYNRLMGRDAAEESTRLAIKPENLEKRIDQLNREADTRAKVSAAIRSAHGDTSVAGQKIGFDPVEVKEVAPRVKAVKGNPAATGKAQQDVVANALKAGAPAPALPDLPPRPAEEPGVFWGKQLDEKGTQIGWKRIVIGEGPGTPHVNQPSDQFSDPMRNLIGTVEARIPPKLGVVDRMRAAVGLGDAVKTGVNAVMDASNKARASIAGLRDLLTKPSQWTDLKDSTGKFSAALQDMSKNLYDFEKVMKKSHPEKLSRVAITNYIEAGGDEELLAHRRDQSKGALAKGYDRATRLTDEEKLTAYHISQTMTDLWQVAHENGILDSFVENYMRHVYEPEYAGTATNKITSAYNGNSLRPDPGFARQRFHESYFEAEQRGKIPLDKDAGFLTGHYYREMNQALAARAYVRALHEGVMPDGERIVTNAGGGTVLGDADKPNSAYIVTARGAAETADGRPYQFLDAPALRKFVYAVSDEKGNPVFVKADAKVHPDAYKFLKNQFAASPLRSSPIGRFVMGVQGYGKQVMMSLSAFHQGQLDLHSLFHGLNPFNVGEVDMDHPLTRELLDHGLQLFDPSGRMDWGEGLQSGAVNKIPGLGTLNSRYQDWLWNKHLPELKQAMAQKAFEANLTRYAGTMSRDQIGELTANQANAAFGGINYRMLGRSAGQQDAFRMLLLAPDFLEARARFVGQALKIGGREQATALLRGAVGMYAGARIINAAINGGDTHTDQPFGVVANGQVYSLRSIPGDLAKLADDWRGFVATRLNPYTIRTGRELLEGRDDLGRKVNMREEASDFAKQFAPIPAQRMFQDKGSLFNAALQMIGVQSAKYYTPVEESLRKSIFARESADARNLGNPALRQLRNLLDSGDETRYSERANDALNKGLVSDSQLDELEKQYEDPELTRLAKRATISELAEAWKHTRNQDERNQLMEVVQDKTTRMEKNEDRLPPAEFERDEKTVQEGFR